MRFFGSGDDRDDGDEEARGWTGRPPTLPPWMGPPEDVPDGQRVSNLSRRRGRGTWASIEERPEGAVFFEHGGGGGSGGQGRVRMRPAFWLWPLPDSGAIRVFCEWPVVEIPLSSVELDVAPLVEAKARIVPLWPSA